MFNHNLFFPPSFCSHIVSMPCWHRKCQGFQRWHIKKMRSQLPMLHHAFVPTHPEPKPQKYTAKLHILRTLTFISRIHLLNFAVAARHVTARICANPSWTYLPKVHHKTSDPKVFISHIYLFWTLPEQLSMLHHACVPTHPEPTFQGHTTKPQTLKFSSHTSLFWILAEQLAILHHACVPTHPVPTSQDQDERRFWKSFCVAGAIFGELGNWFRVKHFGCLGPIFRGRRGGL